MKKLLIGLVALVLVVVGVAYVQAGPSFFETSIKYIFSNGITVSGGTASFSGATVTGLSASFSSDITLENSEYIDNDTNGSIIFGRNDSGTVTLSAADDDATAALTIAPGGGAAMTLGGASMTALTVTSDGTGNGEVVLPAASVGSAELGGATWRAAFCGENAENGTTYFGPAGITVSEPALASADCDALDNTTEATADVVVSAGLVLTPKYMACRTDGTLGASETLTFQLRDDTADVTGVTCQIVEAGTSCDVAVPTASAIAAGSAIAVSVIEVSNNADDNAKCVVLFQVQ